MPFCNIVTPTRTSESQIHSWEKDRASSTGTSQIPRPMTTRADGPMSRGPTHSSSRERRRTAARSGARLALAIIAFVRITAPTQTNAPRMWKNFSQSWSSTAPPFYRLSPGAASWSVPCVAMHRVHQVREVAPCGLALDRHPQLLRDATRREILLADHRHDPLQSQRVEGVVSPRRGGLRRDPPALIAPAHDPAEFDLRTSLHEGADQATISDQLTGTAKDDGAPPEPVVLVAPEVAFDPRPRLLSAERRPPVGQTFGVSEHRRQLVEIAQCQRLQFEAIGLQA